MNIFSLARKPAGPVPEALADQVLIERVAQRDRGAFTELYQRYHRRLMRFLSRFTWRLDVAEEIVNDTMYVVWCKAPEFRAESQLSTWIMGIAYRRALKTLQRLTQLPDAAAPEAADDSAEESQIRREWLDRALAQLPLDQRMVLELTYFLGHSCEEIATIMDCPVNTVKTRMFHARAKLRVSLPALAGLSAAPQQGEKP